MEGIGRMRRSKARTTGDAHVVATAVTDPGADVVGHARRLSVVTLRVLAAVRFDASEIPSLCSAMRYDIVALATSVEGLGRDEPEGICGAARVLLRSALLAHRATMGAVTDGSWGGRLFDAAEQACAELVQAQEAFAERFGPERQLQP